MRRSPLAVVLLATAVVVLAACAPPSAGPEQTAVAAPSSSPSPSPTPEVMLVGAGERPPTAFDGDCEAAMSRTELGDAYGYEVAAITARDEKWTRSITAAGGLSCEWEGGRLEVIPRAGLGEAQLAPGSYTYYFEECDWACAWVWADEAVWITGADWRVEGRTRAEVDAIGAVVGPAIAARWADADRPVWERDRTGWWPEFECEQLAAAVGGQLGAAVAGAAAGYHDPAGAATEIGDAAMHRSWCGLSDDAGAQFALVTTEAGSSWDVPWAEDARPIDLGVPGIESFVRDQGGPFVNSYELTDGVNVVSAEIGDEARWSEQQIATAIAAAAASDFP